MALGGLSIDKLPQISMDSHNVNWKVLEFFSEKVSTDYQKTLMHLWSCVLLVINGILWAGHNYAKGNVSTFWRGLYCLFKCSPSPRTDNHDLTSRIVLPTDVLSNVKQYVENKEKLLKTKTVLKTKNVKSCVQDTLMTCKMQFFSFVPPFLEPFIRGYYSYKTLASFFILRCWIFCIFQYLDKLKHYSCCNNTKIYFVYKSEKSHCCFKVAAS